MSIDGCGCSPCLYSQLQLRGNINEAPSNSWRALGLKSITAHSLSIALLLKDMSVAPATSIGTKYVQPMMEQTLYHFLCAGSISRRRRLAQIDGRTFSFSSFIWYFHIRRARHRRTVVTICVRPMCGTTFLSFSLRSENVWMRRLIQICCRTFSFDCFT